MSQLNPVESGYYWARLADGELTVVCVDATPMGEHRSFVSIDVFGWDAACSLDSFLAAGHRIIERIKEPPGEEA